MFPMGPALQVSANFFKDRVIDSCDLPPGQQRAIMVRALRDVLESPLSGRRLEFDDPALPNQRRFSCPEHISLQYTYNECPQGDVIKVLEFRQEGQLL